MFHRLIIIAHILGFADESPTLSSSLTVTRKFKRIYLYIFLVIYLEKMISRLVFPQMHIFNIFPSAWGSGCVLGITKTKLQ